MDIGHETTRRSQGGRYERVSEEQYRVESSETQSGQDRQGKESHRLRLGTHAGKCSERNIQALSGFPGLEHIEIGIARVKSERVHKCRNKSPSSVCHVKCRKGEECFEEHIPCKHSSPLAKHPYEHHTVSALCIALAISDTSMIIPND